MLTSPRAIDFPLASPFSRAPADGADLIGSVMRYGRDQEVFGQGAPASHVYRVLRGMARRFNLLTDGRRQISDFYLPGDIFGLETGPEHRGTVEAVGDCALIVAPRSSLDNQLRVTGWLWRLTMGEHERGHDHLLTLGRRGAVERVCWFLIDLADRTDATDQLEVPMSRQDIADYLGLTIETVSRTVTHLAARGLIGVRSRRSIHLRDRAALAALCE